MATVDPNSPHGKAIRSHHIVVWWKSKKFVAYMASEILSKVIISAMLYVVYSNGGALSASWLTLLLTVIVTAGVAEMGFLGGQAWIDRYGEVVKIPIGIAASAAGLADDDSHSEPPLQPVRSDSGDDYIDPSKDEP